jgi:hypothetical protein
MKALDVVAGIHLSRGSKAHGGKIQLVSVSGVDNHGTGLTGDLDPKFKIGV